MSASRIERGDIFYIHKNAPVYGSEQMAGRPGIIVSNEKNNEFSEVVEVVYMTTQEKTPLPTHVTIRSTPRMSTAPCEQITSVSVERLGDYIGKASKSEMANIETAMLISLDLYSGQVREKIVEVPVEVEKEVVIEVVAPVEAELAGEIVNVAKITAERDTYKLMYEKLLDKLIKVG